MATTVPRKLAAAIAPFPSPMQTAILKTVRVAHLRRVDVEQHGPYVVVSGTISGSPTSFLLDAFGVCICETDSPYGRNLLGA